MSLAFVAPDLHRVEALPVSSLVLFRFADLEPLSGITSLLDWRLCGHLSRMVLAGFLTGEAEESLLVPPGRRLPQQHVIVFGLGARDDFGRDTFRDVIGRMYDALPGLGGEGVALCLPGRAEGACDGALAIDWFLACYEDQPAAIRDEPTYVLEPPGAQKAMLPAVERWRLKQLVP